ncbi:hypothetical protein N0V93_009185 [Gnomoniopsis smithogilvyi]|uniref:Arb2 domain-containing protein n=1 Tax=Gnomoniopsis smithogilvyi TaxID=1191159 RepID=A0A9W9CTG3_9PEZI|nr:hypothetical protein N0V93_009185 [Gnomoniopsis smithogilvyi]
MFRRRWSGLPEDPDFPADLEKLGYFVNEEDEIRSITDPKFYFDYFISKSMRYNDRQRFAFTLAVQDLVHARLTSAPHHFTKLALPLQTPLTRPHTPIFLSPNLNHKKRVLVLFGERDQDLGVLAHRVLGGKGGVNEGSVVSIVKALREDVGVVLANTGERWWWPEEERALSYRQSQGVRMKSAVLKGRFFDPKVNGIPGNDDVGEHVRMVFESVLANRDLVGKEASLEIIGLSEGAVEAEKYLDQNWKRWEDRIGCLAILGGGLDEHAIQNEGFRAFLKEKARAYITCSTPLNTSMANPGGNPYSHYHTTYGCPVLSSGEPYHSELAVIKAKGVVLPWMDEVYDTGGRYRNPVLNVTFKSEEFEDTPEFVDYPEYVPFPPRQPGIVDASALTDGDELEAEIKEAEIKEAEKLAREAEEVQSE